MEVQSAELEVWAVTAVWAAPVAAWARRTAVVAPVEAALVAEATDLEAAGVGWAAGESEGTKAAASSAAPATVR